MIELKEVQEWFAKKCNKTVKEFDDYDVFVAKVAYDYANEAVKDYIRFIFKEQELVDSEVDVMFKQFNEK